jgi:flagellar biosynthesis chaperone FliJ
MYQTQLERMREKLQAYVDNNADRESEIVQERVEAYTDAIDALTNAIYALDDAPALDVEKLLSI